MQCPRCHAENRADRRFCGECGLPFASTCRSCGFQNEGTEKFCGGCGMLLNSTLSAPTPRFASPQSYTPGHLAEKILTSKAALEGERKQVTVLFADLKGSMELLADRDPEEARRILDPMLQLMMDAVHRYEGTVNQVMGDGIMALFGAPLAHEDHAVRACYAALRMQQLVKQYAEDARPAHGVNVQIRVGLNSGEVVVRYRQRSPHGLHRRGADHAFGRPDGADRTSRRNAADGRHAWAGPRVCAGHATRSHAGEGYARVGRSL